MLGAKLGGDIVEIGHGAHVDPGLRHGDRDIGKTEAERFEQHDLVVRTLDIADQVLSGDAEMHRATHELRCDLACRQIGDLDAIDAADAAAIFADTTRLDHRKPRFGKELVGAFLHPPLGRHGEHE